MIGVKRLQEQLYINNGIVNISKLNKFRDVTLKFKSAP